MDKKDIIDIVGQMGLATATYILYKTTESEKGILEKSFKHDVIVGMTSSYAVLFTGYKLGRIIEKSM